MFAQSWFFESKPQTLFRGRVERIHILLDWTFEQERDLRDNRNVLPQGMKAHLKCIMLPDVVSWPNLWLKDTKESLNDRRLASTGAANYSHLLSGAGLKSNIFKHKREIFFISSWEVSQGQWGLFGPLLMQIFIFLSSLDLFKETDFSVVGCPKFLFSCKMLELKDTLAADHETFSEDNLSKSPLEKITDGDEVDDSYSI